MTLPPTKYGNTYRTIAGLNNVVYNSDVILFCNTTSAAVTLTLPEVSPDHWLTTYRLYVIDQSGNAGTNSITINAPVGYTVNNAASLTINVNNGIAVFSISSNTSFLATTNFGTPSALAIKDEGVLLTSSASSIDFVGAGVTATAVGTAVTVTINGTAFIALTSAQLLTLISGAAVIPNQGYLVTDAIFTVSVPETVPITVTGITTTAVSVAGNGIFQNADYQNIGNYSGIVGFVSNLGVWNSVLAPVANDVVIWNNLHWNNLTGVNTATSPDLDAVNWVLLPKSSTNGYITEVDTIQYQASSNHILSRGDVRLNYVENNFITYPTLVEAFLTFQWGNNSVGYNSVTGESAFAIWNNAVIGNPVDVPYIAYNKVDSHSDVEFSLPNEGTIRDNIFTGQSAISVNENKGVFESNKFTESTSGSISIGLTADLSSNTFSLKSHLTIVLTAGAQFIMNICSTATLTATYSGDIKSNEINNTTFNVVAGAGTINNNQFVKATFSVSTINDGSIINNTISYSSLTISVNRATGVIEGNIVSQDSAFTIVDNDSNVLYNLVESDSVVLLTYNTGTFGKSSKNGGNIVSSKSTLALGTNASEVGGNQIVDDSSVNIATNNGSFLGNSLNTSSTILITTNSNPIVGVVCENSSFGIVTNSVSISGGAAIRGVGSIKYVLDCADPTIYDLLTTTLTIPNGLESFFGYYTLLNANGLTISKIVNSTANWNTEFVNDAGAITTFAVSAVGLALANEIIDKSGAPSYAITYRLNGTDSVLIKRVGNLNTVQQANIWV